MTARPTSPAGDAGPADDEPGMTRAPRGEPSAAPPRIGLVRLPHAAGLEPPAYMTVGAAGADVRAAVAEPLILAPGARAAVPTGLILAIPAGYEVQVRPRSGLALKHGVTVVNAPGTIDSDYRDELRVLLVNLGAEAFAIARGDRIAQLVVAPVAQAIFGDLVAPPTAVRVGGFGSTG